jgi:hypothetical protein
MRRRCATAVLTLSIMCSAKAELIQADAFTTNDGLAVHDTVTGLTWLDLSVTRGMGHNEASQSIRGWTTADALSVQGLLDTAFPDLIINDDGLGAQYRFQQDCLSENNTSPCYLAARQWEDLFGGHTGDVAYQSRSLGLYVINDTQVRAGGTYINGDYSVNLYGSEFTSRYQSLYSQGSEDYGVFMVKAVDVPVSFGIMGAAMALLGWRREKR